MSRRRQARGFSLIEALVALAVMAFGMLGVLGVQATLRLYSDVAKQRSEATRIAQDTIEDLRAYTGLTTSAGADYADIVSMGPVAVTGTMAANKNTNFLVERTVVDLPNTAAMPLAGKWVSVDVNWVDRANQTQSIRLATHVAGVTPELAGTFIVPAFGGPARLPGGRHAGIPRAAVDQGDGTSRFSPPGGESLVWVFNNTSGAIRQVCTPGCVDFLGSLVAGYVRYSTAPLAPTPANAENPTSDTTSMSPIGVQVNVTAPTPDATTCFTEAFTRYVAYFCAVPVTESTRRWSGRTNITGLSLASSIGDADATRARVCRYTPLRAHTGVTAAEHPLNYVNVNVPLVNQNFLIIRAGNDSVAFDCPADDPSTPEVNGNTWHHQPSS